MGKGDPQRSEARAPVTVTPRRQTPEALRRTIYLSSTYGDLVRPRAAVAEAIERLQGHTVVGMESYLASDQRPLDRCLSDVAMCDYYVGLFAWRYGFVPPGEARSITELEFREAVRSNKPRLIFILDEGARWPQKSIDAHRAQIEALREELMTTHLVTLFRSAAQLPLFVSVAVANQTMVELRGVRAEAHEELLAGLTRLDDILVFLALLPTTAAPGPKATPMPVYAPRGRIGGIDLRDERVVEALRATSISPPRPLNAPYDAAVPFGTDRRMIDAIVSEETRAAEQALRSALSRYSAAELGVEALHATEDVVRHPFIAFLEAIKEEAATRRFMEDSQRLDVPVVDSGIGGGWSTNYLEFVDALDALRAAIQPTADAKT